MSGSECTRGAVMTLASFDGIESTVSWLGVGNIEESCCMAIGLRILVRETIFSASRCRRIPPSPTSSHDYAGNTWRPADFSRPTASAPTSPSNFPPKTSRA